MGSEEKWEALANQSVKTIKLSAMTETVTHTGFWLTHKQYTVKSMKHHGPVCMNVGGWEFIGFCVQQKANIYTLNTFMGHLWRSQLFAVQHAPILSHYSIILMMYVSCVFVILLQ